MKKTCARCGQILPPYSKHGVLCPRCREKLQCEFDKKLALLDSVAFTVDQASKARNLSAGHLRRVLGNREKYPWGTYGIVDAYKKGKQWQVFLTSLEHRKAETQAILRIGLPELNILRLKACLGLKRVLTVQDVTSIFDSLVNPPHRRSASERQERIRRLKEDPDKAADMLIKVLGSFFEELAKDNE